MELVVLLVLVLVLVVLAPAAEEPAKSLAGRHRTEGGSSFDPGPGVG
ncbi:hypothetical protein [Streptomyces sp. NPDC088746]